MILPMRADTTHYILTAGKFAIITVPGFQRDKLIFYSLSSHKYPAIAVDLD